MPGEVQSRQNDRSEEKPRRRTCKTDANLRCGPRIAIAARSQAAQGVQRDPRMPAVVTLHEGVAQLVYKNGNEYDGHPDDELCGRRPLAGVEAQEHRAQPK